MNPRKQMYNLLEKMVECAENNDKDGVSRLNTQYGLLIPKVYHNPPTELDLEYDSCRVACASSVGMLVHLHKALILDAKQRLSRIPKPN